jgi:hypothetical protein
MAQRSVHQIEMNAFNEHVGSNYHFVILWQLNDSTIITRPLDGVLVAKNVEF